MNNTLIYKKEDESNLLYNGTVIQKYMNTSMIFIYSFYYTKRILWL